MLRYYDEAGLLKPAIVDKFSGYRYYEEFQLSNAAKIAALRDMGFGINEIGEILSLGDSTKAVELYLKSKKDEVQLQIDSAKDRLLLLESAIIRLGKDGKAMKYDVVLKEIPKRYVASVRKVIPSYDQEGMLWNIMMEEVGSKITPLNPCYSLAIFHDCEYKEKDVDVEIQMSVKGSYEDTKSVVFKTVDPIQTASATYKGSYTQETEVMQEVANWVKDNGYEFNGVAFSIYHVSPHETSNPDELVTEVCYPVKKK